MNSWSDFDYLPFADGPYRMTMGLMALKPADWIEGSTAGTHAEIALRKSLLEQRRDEVLRALPGSEAACREVLEQLAGISAGTVSGTVRACGKRIGQPGQRGPVDRGRGSLPIRWISQAVWFGRSVHPSGSGWRASADSKRGVLSQSLAAVGQAGAADDGDPRAGSIICRALGQAGGPLHRSARAGSSGLAAQLVADG